MPRSVDSAQLVGVEYPQDPADAVIGDLDDTYEFHTVGAFHDEPRSSVDGHDLGWLTVGDLGKYEAEEASHAVFADDWFPSGFAMSAAVADEFDVFGEELDEAAHVGAARCGKKPFEKSDVCGVIGRWGQLVV